MASTVGDERCVPLARREHRKLHDWGRSAWEVWGVDPEAAILRTQEEWFAKFGTRPWLER